MGNPLGVSVYDVVVGSRGHGDSSVRSKGVGVEGPPVGKVPHVVGEPVCPYGGRKSFGL